MVTGLVTGPRARRTDLVGPTSSKLVNQPCNEPGYDPAQQNGVLRYAIASSNPFKATKHTTNTNQKYAAAPAQLRAVLRAPRKPDGQQQNGSAGWRTQRISTHLGSSHLGSSRLISAHLGSSRLISGHLGSSRAAAAAMAAMARASPRSSSWPRVNHLSAPPSRGGEGEA